MRNDLRRQRDGLEESSISRGGRAGRCVLVALLALGGLGLARPAVAASITVTDVAPLSDVEIGGVLSVSRFDPSLGILTGVSYSITGAIASILGVSNDGPGAINPSVFTRVDFYVDSSDLSLPVSPDFSVLGSTGPVALNPGESALFPLTAQTTITGSEAPSAAFLLPGTIDVSFATVTSFGGESTGGDVTISQATDAGIELRVTYEYDVVPEPGTLAMVAFGLSVIAGARRQASRT